MGVGPKAKNKDFKEATINVQESLEESLSQGRGLQGKGGKDSGQQTAGSTWRLQAKVLFGLVH